MSGVVTVVAEFVAIVVRWLKHCSGYREVSERTLLWGFLRKRCCGHMKVVALWFKYEEG